MRNKLKSHTVTFPARILKIMRISSGITNISPRAMGSRPNILAMPVLILSFILILDFPFSQASVTLKACEWYLVRISTARHSAKDYERSKAAEKEKKSTV